MEFGSGRMVGSVNLRMTILAASAHNPRVRKITGVQKTPGQQIIHMAGHGMAPLAQNGSRSNQQPFMIGPVRQVTIQAILRYRCVLEKKWAALFGMTAKTCFIYISRP